MMMSAPVFKVCHFVFENRQEYVTLRLLIEGPQFDSVGCNPERVSGRRHSLNPAGPDGPPVMLDSHLTADQIIPLSIVAQRIFGSKSSMAVPPF